MSLSAKLSLAGLIALIISTSANAASAQSWSYKSKSKSSESSFNVAYYKPRFTTGPFYDTQVHSFGLYDLFVPFAFNEKNILFLDGRYLENHGPTHEGNFGAGFRHILGDNKSIIGGYGFFDVRSSTRGNMFHQITLGGEFTRLAWSLRTNVYIPVGTTAYFVNNLDFASLVPAASGPFQNIAFRRGQEKAMTGGDVLGGFYVPKTHGLRIYLGGYVYAASGVQTAAGPIIHSEYNIHRKDGKRLLKVFNKIYLVADYQHDDLRGSVWFAGARFDIMLGHQRQLTGIQTRMQDFVRRDLAIEAGPNTQAPTQLLRNADGSLATVQQISSAFTASAANVIGVSGAINNGANSVTLADGQTITGGNFPFVADGHQFNLMVGSAGSITTAAAATAPAITFQGANLTGTKVIENITVTSNSTNAGSSAIGNNQANAVGTVIIRGVNASYTSNASAYAVDFRAGGAAAANANNITVEDSTITSSTGSLNFAVRAGANVMTATVKNNTMTTTANNRAVDFFADGGGTLTVGDVTGNTISSAVANSNTVRIIATGAFDGGIGGTVNVTGNFSGNTITNTGAAFESALLIQASDGNTAGTTATINATGAFNNNTFTSNGGLPVVLIQAEVQNAGPGSTSTITFQNTSGLTNNTITSTNGGGQIPVSVVTANTIPNTSNLTLNNFFGNTLDPNGGATGINVNESAAGTSNLIINVGNGATGLSASNGNAVVTTTGTPTYNPSA